MAVSQGEKSNRPLEKMTKSGIIDLYFKVLDLRDEKRYCFLLSLFSLGLFTTN